MLLAAIVAVLGLWAGPRFSYYRGRATYHSREEAFHRFEIQTIRRRVVELDDDPPEYQVWDHSQKASAHSRQKEAYRRAAFSFWAQTPADVAISYPWDQKRDRQVIEAAIVGWMDHKYEGAEPLEPGDSDWHVVIDRMTTIEPWEEIGSVKLLTDHGFPGELSKAIQRRNAAPVSLDQFKFDDRRIVIDDLAKLREQGGPRVASWIGITLPAYSDDGKLAVVSVTVLSYPHSMSLTHGLVYADSRWVLRWNDRYVTE